MSDTSGQTITGNFAYFSVTHSTYLVQTDGVTTGSPIRVSNNAYNTSSSPFSVGVTSFPSSITSDTPGIQDASAFSITGNTILTASTTNFTTFVGFNAGASILTIATSSDLTSGTYTTALGYQAHKNATSSGDVAVGYQAMLGSLASTGGLGQNSAVGYQAMKNITSGTQNSAFGYGALLGVTSGAQDTAIGRNSETNVTTGGGNVGVGQNALNSNQTGNNNVAVGNGAGNGVASNSFSNNSLFGHQSGFALTTGSNNVFLGYRTASTTATGANNIALGYDIALPLTNGSNQLDIGNLIFGTGVNGTVSTGHLEI